MPLPLLHLPSWLLICAALLLIVAPAASAQQTGLLYDPEPPANAAYVRVLVASGDGAVDVDVDGKPRIAQLRIGEASDYMVLSAGKHSIVLHPAGRREILRRMPLDVVQGRAMTLAFPGVRADALPMVFEDKAGANKLKAMLAVYHLDPASGPFDVVTADGKTKVFSALVPGASAAIAVNPIAIELMATRAGDAAAQARIALTMTPGAAYSVFFLRGAGGKTLARAAQNRVERYTGK